MSGVPGAGGEKGGNGRMDTWDTPLLLRSKGTLKCALHSFFWVLLAIS